MAGRREWGLHFCGQVDERPKNLWPVRLFKYPMRMHKVLGYTKPETSRRNTRHPAGECWEKQHDNIPKTPCLMDYQLTPGNGVRCPQRSPDHRYMSCRAGITRTGPLFFKLPVNIRRECIPYKLLCWIRNALV